MAAQRAAALASLEGEAACFHCDLPIPPGADFHAEVEGRSRAYCCAGCEAVSLAIVGGGLGDYYRLRDRAAARADPQAGKEDLSLYDDALVQSRFARATKAGLREAPLLLEGIRCSACAWLIEQRLAGVRGVKSAQVNYATHRALVTWDPNEGKLSEALAAVRAVGYGAWPCEEGRLALIEGRERRTLLRRLLVAGLGMMQVMMYAVPAYLAGEGELTADIESLMRWAGLLLTLPVILYSAAPFFQGAWRDLRLARLGMDTPVALGIAAAFAASVAATILGDGPVYFDSVAMFVFLLSGGRYLELLARQSAGRSLEGLARLMPASAHRLLRVGDLAHETVPVALLTPGDRVLVRSGESIPADGALESAEATVSEALLSGESRPILKQAGAALLGGAMNTGSALVMRVERVGADTALSAIARLMERALGERPRWEALARRAASIFVGVIVLAALAAGLAWLWIDSSRALWVAVSVLIVTCPCALSLATPAALTVATGEMARANLVVSRGHAIEALAAATDFVFDKTGTLTHGRPRLFEVLPLGPLDSSSCVQVAAAIAQGSGHPLDRALGACVSAQPLPAVESHRSFPGAGAEANIAGHRHRIGRADFVAELHGLPPPIAWMHAADSVVWLGSEAGWIAAFRLGDTVRREAKAAIASLRARGKRVHLLSGDDAPVSKRVAADLGIGAVEARATPERKLAYVRLLQRRGARVAMVGDGINDAPVLAQADVSIAMGGGADLAQVRADCVLISDSLCDLVSALDIAERTRQVIRQNLAWGLAYNLIVLPLAFAGMVTPLLAGIGMSASSLLVVANALRLRR